MNLHVAFIGLLISVPNVQANRVIFRLDRIDLCKCGTRASDCNVKDFEAITHHYDRLDTHYDVTFYIKSNISKLRIEVCLEKCRNRESLDSCEDYGTLKPINTCNFIAMRNTFWESSVYGIKPAYTCPMLEGVYVGKNISFVGEKFKVFSTLNVYWKMRLSLFDEERKDVFWTLCLEGFFYKLYRM